jgi:curli biogenesis system outer membrane secretion channel CsgG
MKSSILLVMASTAYCTASPLTAQNRPSVAISQLDDVSGSKLSDQFSIMLESAISSTGKLSVIERAQLSKLVKEKVAVKSGLVSGGPNQGLGGFSGVDYLLYGSITSVTYNENTEGLVGGILGAFFKGRSSDLCTVAMNFDADIKITESQTGQVRYSSRVTDRQDVSVDCVAEKRTIDYSPVLRTAAKKIAYDLVTSIYPMQVASASVDGTIIVNYGSEALPVGSVVKIYRKGDAFKDPATGEVLGSDDILLGTATITEANARFSKAKLVGKPLQSIDPGSIVRLQPSIPTKK